MRELHPLRIFKVVWGIWAVMWLSNHVPRGLIKSQTWLRRKAGMWSVSRQLVLELIRSNVLRRDSRFQGVGKHVLDLLFPICLRNEDVPSRVRLVWWW